MQEALKFMRYLVDIEGYTPQRALDCTTPKFCVGKAELMRLYTNNPSAKEV